MDETEGISKVDLWTLRRALDETARGRVDAAWRDPVPVLHDGVLASVGRAKSRQMQRWWGRGVVFWGTFVLLSLDGYRWDSAWDVVFLVLGVAIVAHHVWAWRRARRSVAVLASVADDRAASARAEQVRAGDRVT